MRNPILATLTVALLPVLATPPATAGPPPASPAQDRPSNPAYAPIDDVPGLPRVLLLGDSISIGYTLDARRALDGVANVHRPPENCGPTIRGLDRIDAWLGDGPWDVIHVNFGLHDLKFVDDRGRDASPETGRHQVPLDAYRANLDALFSRLSATGATVIFATTTPVPPGEPRRRAGDQVAYNAVAVALAERHGIAVNDLHAFILPRFDALATRPGNVHFTDEGSTLLGDRVAEVIAQAIRDRP